ncbi:MAG: hypothetical protein QOH37_3718, partial [Nocardioidaceae bacterium]|nr:hypothetical protein [Nocardioidaceae bacterium]
MRWTRSPVFVAVVAVVDAVVLVLAYLAVHHQRAPVADSPPVATSTADAAPSTLPIVGPLSLATSPSGGLMRATRGTCDRREPVRARVWVAPTYLAPLRAVTVPGLQEALGTAMTDGLLTVVGADAACKVHGYTSGDGGRTWRTAAAPTTLWRLDTDSSASLVHGPVPGGVLNIDCVPIAVSTVAGGDRALITCSGFNVIDQPRRRTVTPITYGV